MPKLRPAALLGLTLLAPASQSWGAEVVTSIKPLELLVRAVAGNSVEITSLVPSGASPHTYNMRPSQRRALENADAIFWVGPEMESFLTRILAGDDFKSRAVALTPGSDATEEHTTGHDEHDHLPEPDHHDHHDEHDHGEGEDPHTWLDPMLALEMAHTIRNTLVSIEGLDAKILDNNLERFEASLVTTDKEIEAQLAPVREIGLFSYHDAFTRFAEHYDLSLEGILTLNPELSPGARHIQEVQAKLQAAPNPCVLTEPQFNRQWWTGITEGINVRFSTWDPLASDIESNAEGYQNFLLSISSAVTACLPEDTEH
ncbi:zinc ABC transporter substrate-binding protein [Marinobacter sp. F4216]|uniref:zinc ABC transporter substrate-binding protein n=1 Tax=Marinobacter sp. F4216 TaxID=2874281 RepID=UPI001CBE9444|nr:zinc ABC transporter substrate-binding protein [Marinobacter sp. F4216]MBZ2167614.1 zinc ABC transporter substrate-binding protein [Marinobacter sp. F4216]